MSAAHAQLRELMRSCREDGHELVYADLVALETTLTVQASGGVRCHNDACCGGQLPCPSRQACGLGPEPSAATPPHHPA